MMRRFGPPREAGRRYSRRVGVYAVALRGGRVLLTCQAAPGREFQLPGGGVDDGEARLAALHREVLEETGWRLDVKQRLGAFRRFTYMPDYKLWAEKLCVIYLARPVRRVGAPSEAGHSAHWQDATRAVALLDNEGDRAFLRAVLNRRSRGGTR